MELTILDKLINGTIKPWKFDFQNTKKIVEIIKAARPINQSTYENLLAYLVALLQDHPTLQKELVSAGDQKCTLKALYYQPELPDYGDIPTQYYKLLIDAEVVRVFNSLILQYPGWEQPVDVVYNVMATLNNIKVLTLQAISELKEIDAVASLTGSEKLTQFVLQYLVASITALYFSVQEEFKAELPQLITQEDYHMLDLQQPLATFREIELIESEEEPEEQQASGVKLNRISFGFKGDKVKLKSVISQLCSSIALLDEKTTTKETLINTLTAKNIEPESVKIKLDCETTQFRYVVDELGRYFRDFKPAAIGKSKAFYSKKDNLITAQALSSSKVETPKEKEEIDRIINHLQ